MQHLSQRNTNVQFFVRRRSPPLPAAPPTPPPASLRPGDDVALFAGPRLAYSLVLCESW